MLTATTLVALTASCADDDDSASSTTTSVASTTTESTTSTSTTTTSTTAELCGDVPAAGPDDGDEHLRVDVDGDGADDDVFDYRAGDEWHLRVELAAGGSSDIVIAPTAAGEVDPIGGVDVDGDGGDELWATVGSGASATIVSLFRFDDCALGVVSSGRGHEFAVGASVGSASGIECRSRPGDEYDVLFLQATSDDGRTYRTTTTPRRLDGDQLVSAGATTRGTVQASSPDFDRYASFRCGPLRL